MLPFSSRNCGMALSKKFMDTIDDAITNAAWDGYDDLIQKETQDYNTRLATTARYSRVEW